MAITVTRNNAVSTDGTLTAEIGRNTQSQICEAICDGPGDIDTTFPVAHDLGFKPTWVQVETCYHAASGQGFVAPTLLGTPGVDGRYNADAANVYLRMTSAVPAVTPVVFFTMHCGCTHSTAR